MIECFEELWLSQLSRGLFSVRVLSYHQLFINHLTLMDVLLSQMVAPDFGHLR